MLPRGPCHPSRAPVTESAEAEAAPASQVVADAEAEDDAATVAEPEGEDSDAEDDGVERPGATNTVDQEELHKLMRMRETSLLAQLTSQLARQKILCDQAREATGEERKELDEQLRRLNEEMLDSVALSASHGAEQAVSDFYSRSSADAFREQDAAAVAEPEPIVELIKPTSLCPTSRRS